MNNNFFSHCTLTSPQNAQNNTPKPSSQQNNFTHKTVFCSQFFFFFFLFAFIQQARIFNYQNPIEQTRGLSSLVNDNHVDNNLKEILVYVYSLDCKQSIQKLIRYPLLEVDLSKGRNEEETIGINGLK